MDEKYNLWKNNIIGIGTPEQTSKRVALLCIYGASASESSWLWRQERMFSVHDGWLQNISHHRCESWLLHVQNTNTPEGALGMTPIALQGRMKRHINYWPRHLRTAKKPGMKEVLWSFENQNRYDATQERRFQRLYAAVLSWERDMVYTSKRRVYMIILSHSPLLDRGGDAIVGWEEV